MIIAIVHFHLIHPTIVVSTLQHNFHLQSFPLEIHPTILIPTIKATVTSNPLYNILPNDYLFHPILTIVNNGVIIISIVALLLVRRIERGRPCCCHDDLMKSKRGGCMTKTSVNAHATAYAVLRSVTSVARTCRQRAAIFSLGEFSRAIDRDLGAKGTGEKLSPTLWPTRTAGISEIVGQRAPPSHLFHRVMNSAKETFYALNKFFYLKRDSILKLIIVVWSKF